MVVRWRERWRWCKTLCEGKWWFGFGWFSIAFDLNSSSIFRLSCLSRVLFVYLAFYLIYLAFICRKKIRFLILKFLIFRPFVFYRLARFFYFCIAVWYFSVVTGDIWDHCMTSSLVICFFFGSLFTGSLRRITFRYSPGGSVCSFIRWREWGLTDRVFSSIFGFYSWSVFLSLWYIRFDDGWQHSGVRLWPLGEAGWSFVLLGWNWLVEAFSFHSLSCFCGVFEADSVGK